MSHDKKEILCTIGPSSLNEWTINRLQSLGVSLFRINLSHTSLEDLPVFIHTITENSDVPICLDTEGAQIRTSDFRTGSIIVKDHSKINIVKNITEGDRKDIILYPDTVWDQLKVDDLLTIDFDSVLAKVISKEKTTIKIRILNGGEIMPNKAVSSGNRILLPPLTKKDKQAIQICSQLQIKYYALSFVHQASDIDELKRYVPKDSIIISKIECSQAILNLDNIINKSDRILIDRGDLSREEPVERIPFLQKHIISATHRLGKKVYVATNLLESMVRKPYPTRAEVNDIYNTLLDGAEGLVLAAETAIGDYPTKAVSMVKKIINEFDSITVNNRKAPESPNLFSLLVPPHGGSLVEQIESSDIFDELPNMKKVKVGLRELIDAEQIAIGTYSPLKGFMTRNDLGAVLKSNCLSSGIIWTLPIILQLPKEVVNELRNEEKVALTDSKGEVFSILTISDIYSPNLEEVALKWFGTGSVKHPGVKKLFSSGNYFVAGETHLVKKIASSFAEFEFSPKILRDIFNKKGWSRIVGFHTRNVVHRVHEYIQHKSLETTHADGLLISPVTGPKKSGDFNTAAILNSYELLIEKGFFPEGKVILGAFPTYSRYSGPRESVFTALCRKNMGCSHFIIGRDHTGLENYYGDYDSQAIFGELGNIGIKPVFFKSIGFDSKTCQYKETEKFNNTIPISGAKTRQSIMDKERLPDWFIRDEVQDLLLAELESGNTIFQ